MHLYLQLSVCLSLIAYVFAADQTFSKSVCLTKSGSKSIKPIPTSNKSFVTTRWAVKKTTVYPTKIVTPTPKTTVVKRTSTKVVSETAPVLTDIYTSTRTVEIISTFTTTISTTTTSFAPAVTTTVFPSSATTTIQPSPGFTPAAYNQGNPPPKIRGAFSPNNAALGKRGGGGATRCEFHGGKPTVYPTKLYPTAVTCNTFIKIIHTKTSTATARKTITTTLRRSTVTSTSVTVTASTTTIFPVRASSTVVEDFSTTRSTTLASTVTSTETVTNTVTIESAPTATRYAVCDLISTTNVLYTNIAGTESPNTFMSLGSSFASAYECCAACEQTKGCRATAFIASIGYCQGVSSRDDVCDGSIKVVSVGSGGEGGIGVSAGSCGGVGRM